MEELKVGMRVKSSQLQNIKDTYIILTDAYKTPDGDTIGKIGYIGKDIDKTTSHLFRPGARICTIHNSEYDYDIVG